LFNQSGASALALAALAKNIPHHLFGAREPYRKLASYGLQ